LYDKEGGFSKLSLYWFVRRGDFWYPVRVIQREGPKSWRVQWCRECQFAEGGIELGSLATVSTDDIVDFLWLKRPERRKIRRTYFVSG
jgi:hypothetical protein